MSVVTHQAREKPSRVSRGAEELRWLAPLYIAAFVLLLCGISAVNSTVENPGMTGVTIGILAAGVTCSLLLRVAGVSPRAVGWLVSGLAVVALLSGGSPEATVFGLMASSESDPGSQRSLGVLLEWGVLLFSFTMLTNGSVLFGVIPSMALLGLMSSENPNPEMVTYFLGFVLATVFVMGYEGYLTRRGAQAAARSPRAAGSEPAAASVTPAVRSVLALSVFIVGCSLVVGLVASAPLKVFGQNVLAINPTRGASGLPYFQQTLMSEGDVMSLSGASPQLSPQPVLSVRSPEPVYLRGTTYSNYTGESWTGADAGYQELIPVRTDPRTGATFELHPPEYIEAWPARKEIVQHITRESPILGDVHATAEPVRVIGKFERLGTTAGGAVKIPSDPQSGSEALGPSEYTVVSLASTATPEQLRTAEVFRRRYADYRSDRLEVMGRVRRFAEEITANAPTPYDKAAAIAEYLRTHYTYSLDPPLLPDEEDATDFFLFKTKTGYCEHFASAMAILCRVLDIPARVAVGFAPGDWDEESRRYIVRQLHAHAWTEVHFGPYGWITFDPTSGLQAEPPGFLSLSKLWSRLVRLVTSRGFVPQMVLLGMILLTLYVLKVEVWDRRFAEAFRSWRSWRARTDPAARLAREYGRMCAALKPLGVRRQPSQTPHEFQQAVLDAVKGDGRAVREPVATMTELMTLASYSPRSLAASEVEIGPVLVRRVREGVREISRHRRQGRTGANGRNGASGNGRAPEAKGTGDSPAGGDGQ